MVVIVVCLVAVCYFLPPSELKESELPVYYETTMAALDVDGQDVVSATETEDYDVLRSADAIVLYYTSPEFDDFEETVEFVNERMCAGQAVVSMIGSSILDTDGMSSVVPVDRDVYAIAYSTEFNVPFINSIGLMDWDYDKALSDVAEWLYEIGYPDYPDLTGPESLLDHNPDDASGFDVGHCEGSSTAV